MRNLQPASSGSTHLGLLLARAPLGAWLILAGFSKFASDGGVGRFVEKFSRSFPSWVPQAVASAFLHAVPFAELIAGAALVLGVAGRIGGFLAAVLLGVMMLAVTGIRTANMPFSPNAVLLGVALLICLTGPGAISMDRFMWNRADETFRGGSIAPKK